MLYAAETYFLTLLQQALGDSTPISRANDLKESSLRLVVEAVELVIAPEPERRLESERVTPHYVHIFQTQVIADATSFELPDDVTGEVLCVESPPGQTLRPEDDYRVQQRRILLRRTPKQDARNDEARNYVVRLRGAPAQGLVRRDPCTLKLHIHAEANKREGLVPLLRRARAAVLRGAVDTPNLAGSAAEDTSVQVRLLAPVVTWLGTAFDSKQTEGHRGVLRFQVTGTLEQHIVVGPAAVGPRIKRIVVVDQSRGEPEG